MDEFTKEERQILKPFFTNLDKPVFVLINLPEVVKGALFSRYSRSNKSLRRLLLDEFINEPDSGFKSIVNNQQRNSESNLVATQKAEDFYSRVLVGYGDDSVAELGGAHVAIENVSQIIGIKAIEDSRIGLSPLEKSTRYVRYDDKVNGQYRYYQDASIMRSIHKDLYQSTLNNLFDTYSKLMDPISSYIKKVFPQDQKTSDRAYKSTIRAKTCDILRGLLPVATLTNGGVYGNGRAFEYALNKMFASPYKEVQELAQLIHIELNKVIPSFVKRTGTHPNGQEQQYFYKQVEDAIQNTVDRFKLIDQKPAQDIGVALIDYPKEPLPAIIAALVFPYSNKSLSDLTKWAQKLPKKEQVKTIQLCFANRNNRRQKPGRSFETTSYTFDILADIGAYKDLQRHRMLTQQRQALSTDYGYIVPQELTEVGVESDYHKAMQQAKSSFEIVRHDFPYQARYIVPMGYKMRWQMSMNLREAFHLTELRSSPQGHPTYRHIAQEIYKSIQSVHPELASLMKFVDMSDSKRLERLTSEQKIDQKIQQIQSKKHRH